MEANVPYEIDHCLSPHLPILATRLPPSLLSALQQSSASDEDYIVFTSHSEGKICIDGKQCGFRVVQEPSKECYRLERRLLSWMGRVEAKLILQSAISDLNEIVPEAQSPVKRSKRITSDSRQSKETSSLAPGTSAPMEDPLILLRQSADIGTAKPRKRPRSEGGGKDSGERTDGTKTLSPTHHLKWLALRNVPPHISKADIQTLMEGIRMKALYVCVARVPSQYEVYIEFESLAGAELGLLRSGEPIGNTSSSWLVEAIQKPEAVWAKAVGVRLPGKMKVAVAYDVCNGQLPEELRGMRPVELRDRFHPVCKNALSPELVSDGASGLSAANKNFSPIEGLLYTSPSPFNFLDDGIHPGNDADDSITLYIATQIDRLIQVWSTAHLKHNSAVLDVCNRMLSAFQLAYELSWKHQYTLK